MAKTDEAPQSAKRHEALLGLLTDVMKAQETKSADLKAKQLRLVEALRGRRRDDGNT